MLLSCPLVANTSHLSNRLAEPIITRPACLYSSIPASHSNYPWHADAMSNNSAESTLNFCTTIIANPDISGIGVRVSIYAGAILNMVTSRIAMSKGDEAAITEAHRNSLLTSTGLVISAIIEWKTQGLS
ncbi:hypothetical protein RSAG8_12967, partial [Rhizoctonia solani AG-8 WAC10335]